MKTLVIDQDTNLQAFVKNLGADHQQGSELMASLKRFNPQLNFDQLERGTLLMVDEEIHPEIGLTQSPAFAQTDLLVSQLKAALTSTLAETLDALASQEQERKALLNVMKMPAIKRVIEADNGLKARASVALDELKQDQVRLKALEISHRELHQLALTELERLTSLVR